MQKTNEGGGGEGKMEELSAVHRYAGGALFSLALNLAQQQQQNLIPDVPPDDDEPVFPTIVESKVPLWSSEECGLLRHILKYLKINSQAWPGIELTAASPDAKHHVGPFIKILQEDEVEHEASSDDTPGEKSVVAVAKAVDAMALSMNEFAESEEKNQSHRAENTSPGSRPKLANTNDDVVKNRSEEEDLIVFDAEEEREKDVKPDGKEVTVLDNEEREKDAKRDGKEVTVLDNEERDEAVRRDGKEVIDLNAEEREEGERQVLIKQRKIAVLYELMTACVADTPEEKAGKSVLRAGYDARQRAAMRLLALWLDVDWHKVAAIELMVAYTAMAAEKQKAKERGENSEEGQQASGWQKWKRGGLIGAAAVTAGTLLAITGGLAAPAIAAGLTAVAPAIVGVGGLATVVGSAAGSVAVAASFGAAGAGLAGTKMARRTGGVDEFLFLPIGTNHQQGRLAVAIVVSGIVLDAEDYTRPWEGPDLDLERYALRWESKELLAVSTAIVDWLKSSAARELFKAGAMYTVLAGLVAALAWPTTLLMATDWIDSKWSIAVDRSDKAGVLLAKLLLRGNQGSRPVTLMGFSLGARVIFSCLEYLAKQKNGAGAGIVERVVLLGAPITLDEERWKTVRKVVAGRFINAYSTNDWMLGVIYRASLITQGLAGIQIVEVPGIENVDITELVTGHSIYLTRTYDVLQALEIDGFYPVYPSKLYAANFDNDS